MKEQKIVSNIIQDVKKYGDEAIFTYSLKFDAWKPSNFKVKKNQINKAYQNVNNEFNKSLALAKKNIVKFNRNILVKKEKPIMTSPGIKCWREFRPIDKVGLYIPGGNANYASTVLMLGLPALMAGCKKIIICSPPPISDVTLIAADFIGIKEIYQVGGAQAIAAMAYGTESIPKVNKIFGPGNRFVTAAKIQVSQDVAIDMPAGPSEIAILADETANPDYINADLASQLEHGPDSIAITVTPSRKLARKIKFGQIKLVNNISAGVNLINKISPEHLELILKNEKEILKQINNAGSIFLGKYSPVPAGDYISGPNHTLPTAGWAKSCSALSVEDFGKMVEVQKISRTGLKNVANKIINFANEEKLPNHAESIKIRLYD